MGALGCPHSAQFFPPHQCLVGSLPSSHPCTEVTKVSLKMARYELEVGKVGAGGWV
eukprot:SAG11_NODE_36193_length_263_cov_0.530488_1_plen_55_part_10